ncbi:MAG: hypothetical protein ABIR50_05435, partial [Ginsengibacter sp.]
MIGTVQSKEVSVPTETYSHFTFFIMQIMIRLKQKYLLSKVMLLAIILPCLLTQSFAQSANKKDSLSNKIENAEQINPTTVQLIFTDKHRLTIDFYGENIFRAFEDTSGGIVRNPEALPPPNILVENPRRPAGQLTINDGSNNVTIASAKIIIEIDKHTSLFKVINKVTKKVVLEMLQPVEFGAGKVTLVLKENP